MPCMFSKWCFVRDECLIFRKIYPFEVKSSILGYSSKGQLSGLLENYKVEGGKLI